MKTSPEKIIRELLDDPQRYKEQAEKESKVWGKVFSNKRQIEVRKADQLAGAELRMGRNNLPLLKALQNHGLKPDHGLSLACGSGRGERHILGQGICSSFHGIDVAQGALNEARKLAEKEGLAITYEQGDLNEIRLKPGTYDLVLTQNCLHHVLQLEALAREIYRSMTPGGVLWISDYVGETQFQYTDKRLDIVNAVLRILPEKVRTNRVSNRVLKQVQRPTPGKLASPFEAIRSAEIMPVFSEYFDILEKRENGAILRLVTPLGSKQDYLENEDTRALFEMLRYLDKVLIDEGVLEPSGIQCLLRPKPGMLE